MGFGFLALSQYLFYITPPCIPTHSCNEVAIPPMILSGFGTTFIHLSLYPTVNYIVKEDYFGTAYGFIESSTNIGYLIGSLALGDILNIDLGPESEATDLQQFEVMHQTLFILSLCGMMIAVTLNLYDKLMRKKHILNKVGEFDNLSISGKTPSLSNMNA